MGGWKAEARAGEGELWAGGGFKLSTAGLRPPLLTSAEGGTRTGLSGADALGALFAPAPSEAGRGLFAPPRQERTTG